MSDQIETKDDFRAIVMRSWRDADFKARLLSDPRNTLAEAGMHIPAGVTITILEDDPETLHLVLPTRPQGDLSPEELERVAGGTSTRFRQRKTPGTY